MTTKKIAMACAAAAALLSGAAFAQDAPNDTVRRAIHVCASCHGEGGVSRQPAIPSLAGQSAQYTVAQLKDFRAQTRAESGSKAYMWGISALLDDASIQGLADYYAAQKPGAGKTGNAALAKEGQRIFVQGMPGKGVRACASCHGDKAEGAAGFPRLAGQHAPYLLAQLQGFGSKLRPHGVIMREEVRAMTPRQMRAVAEYLQSL